MAKKIILRTVTHEEDEGKTMLTYEIYLANPNAHLFSVTLSFTTKRTAPVQLRLPCWISGSYLIRDFAAQFHGETAFVNGKASPISKTGLSTWQLTGTIKAGSSICIQYSVWAFDRSVRTAYLDQFRGFFNPGALLMAVCGRENEPITLDIEKGSVSTTQNWKVATSLKRSEETKELHFGRYEAPNYDSLIDCPVELGDFFVAKFSSRGISHTLAISNAPKDFDSAKLLTDLKKICAKEIDFFSPVSSASPLKNYTFLMNVTESAFGGLEHTASCALCAPEKCFPRASRSVARKDYIRLLGLFAHEYFHLWFVKRIKPREFISVDFSEATPSRLLWLFEGFTNYYELLFLARSKRINRDEFLDSLSDVFKQVLGNSGRTIETLSDASFDAWIKYYKPTANRLNTQISYYSQGSLAALVLDATIREKTEVKSLDDVIRALWKDFLSEKTYKGVTYKSFLSTLKSATGINLSSLVDTLINTTHPADYEASLRLFGISLEPVRFSAERRLLGINGKEAKKGFLVSRVFSRETAESLGIAPGDILLGIGKEASGKPLSQILHGLKPGDTLSFNVLRDGKAFRTKGKILSTPKCFAKATTKGLSTIGKALLRG